MMLMVFASNNEQIFMETLNGAGGRYMMLNQIMNNIETLNGAGGRTVTDWDLIPAPLTKLGDSCSDLNGITGVYQHYPIKIC